MHPGIWNGHTHSLWLWGFGNIKIQAPGLSLYETRWLWRHLCQQDTGHSSTCRTAQWTSSWAAQKIDHSWNAWATQCLPFCILFCSILMWFYVVHLILFVTLNVCEYVCMCTQVCVCIYIYIYTYTHTHTYINTHTHTHTHTPPPPIINHLIHHLFIKIHDQLHVLAMLSHPLALYNLQLLK